MATSITTVSGIGPKTAEYLKKNGISTVEALVKSGTSKLKVAPGFGEHRAETVLAAAKQLLKSGGKTTQKAKAVENTKSAKGKTKSKDRKKDKKKDKKSKDKSKNRKKDKKSKKGKK